MIISCSRRTDIPAFFSDWFFNRIRAGFAEVFVPSSKRLKSVGLYPNEVDCIVFWTKNPKPMISRLDELSQYNYYFQYTINAYDKSIEPKTYDVEQSIDTYLELADKIGVERIVWRYDPIIFTNQYDVTYHLTKYESIASRIKPKYSVISIVDSYGKVQKNLQRVGHREPSSDELHFLLSGISDVGDSLNMKVTTCGENLNLSRYNITHGKCIDDSLINDLFGTKLKLSKDNSQRMSCGCVMSVDLGVYNTCRNNCVYCYANSGVRLDCHNPNSTTLA